ncbi:MAG: NUDIX hydrolase [Proteobacteria bacterium]|nr:NUDIX hydrolase [Pseudomonadota bacterium]
MPYTYKYPRPMVTVDVVLFALDRKRVLLIKRDREPFKGRWALPGGFIGIKEELKDAMKYKDYIGSVESPAEIFKENKYDFPYFIRKNKFYYLGKSTNIKLDKQEDGSYLFHNPEIFYRKDQLCAKHLQDLSD